MKTIKRMTEGREGMGEEGLIQHVLGGRQVSGWVRWRVELPERGCGVMI